MSPPELVKQFEEVLDKKPEVNYIINRESVSIRISIGLVQL